MSSPVRHPRVRSTDGSRRKGTHSITGREGLVISTGGAGISVTSKLRGALPNNLTEVQSTESVRVIPLLFINRPPPDRIADGVGAGSGSQVL